MDHVLCNYPLLFVVIIATRIQVAIETRKVAAGDLDADAVPGFETIRRNMQCRHIELIIIAHVVQ